VFFVSAWKACHSLDFYVYVVHHFFVEIVVDVGTTKSGTNDHCQSARVTFQTEIRNQNLLVSCDKTLPQKSQL